MSALALEIPISGHHYPNNIGRVYLEAIRELIGYSALTDLLHGTRLERYLDSPPPNNFAQQFDFADFSMLSAGLTQLQNAAPREPSLPYVAGWRCYEDGLKAFGALAGFSQVALGVQIFPREVKIKLGLQAMAGVFSTLSDQTTEIAELSDSYLYRIRRCPMCWGQQAEKPICDSAVGLLAAGLHWMTEQHYRVVESECCATGAEVCTFVIDKKPMRHS